jgi:hypothetical protein
MDLIISISIYKIILSYSLFICKEFKTLEIVLIFQTHVKFFVVYRLIKANIAFTSGDYKFERALWDHKDQIVHDDG